jgi:plastocyanin
MRYASIILASAAFVGLAAAEDFKVQVGNGGLAFDPEQINAKQGDTVTFVCTYSSNGVYDRCADSPYQSTQRTST